MTSARVRSRGKSLRIGFGVVLGVLVASTITAWRIQESLSQRSVEIHRKYLNQQERLTRLREAVWVSSVAARDLLLSQNPDRANHFFHKIKEQRNETEGVFVDLASLGIPERTLRQIAIKYDEFWRELDRLRYTHAEIPPEKYSEYAQTQIEPRRDAVLRFLHGLEVATDASFFRSEADFASSRHLAGIALLLLLGVGLMLATGVAIYSVRYSDRLETQADQQFAEVSRAKQELERLSARLMEVQEQERTRIARELHDEIVQNLAVLKIDITQAETLPDSRAKDRKERLARARELAERTMKTLRNIMTLLRPSMLDDLGLGAALQWLTEDFQRRSGIACTYSEDGIEEALPEAVKTCVYRVIQEAVHNCEKHAGATLVTVRVVRDENALTAEVRDNGRGFNTSGPPGQATRGHFGLLGMRERALSLGGILTIESAAEQGTSVRLTLPLAESSDNGQQKLVEAHV
ncbi:MAG TPA: sensor histidine kinase [Bryobacteraceae bacterium]|nr:sensor histidine kinase [Bryobacteraceae bacterium]